MENLCVIYVIKPKIITPYNPKENGGSRANQQNNEAGDEGSMWRTTPKVATFTQMHRKVFEQRHTWNHRCKTVVGNVWESATPQIELENDDASEREKKKARLKD